MLPLTSLSLLAGFALSACVAAPSAVDEAIDKGRDKGHSLAAELSSGGLDQPQALTGLLEGLGLRLMQDVRRLNAPEQLELAESLRAADVSLGFRSKLRHLANGDAAADHGLGIMGTGANAPARQMQEEQPSSAAAAKSGGGFSVETLAIMVTALLGLASYVLQAKLARDAAHSEKDHDRLLADREKTQRQAALQLERVRSQNADALWPSNNNLVVAQYLQVNLQWELKLPIAETLQRHKQFIRPLALLPHLEVYDGTFSPEVMQIRSASPLEAYGPDDFAALGADESKRDVFMAAYRHSIVPRMRTAADLLIGQRHLLDYPSPTYLDGVFAASGIDWTKFLPFTIGVAAVRYAQHADAWLPIMSMWEREEFSVMFPAAPYFYSPVFMALQAMLGAAGQREEELLGVSSGSHMAAWSSRMDEGMESGGRQADST
jgi:hypothetical protein